MTRNNWIAFAILASATAIAGACSPKGGQAGQTDRATENQSHDQTYTGTDRANTDRTDRTARDRSKLPVSLTGPAGTKIDMTLNDELSSRKNKPGDTFTAKVATDVRDAAGTVVIDAGSTVNGS